MYVTLSQVKQHLQIDKDFKDDDNYLITLVQVAEDAIESNLNIPLASLLKDGVLPKAVFHSILLMIGNLYSNREPVSFTSATKVPYTLEFLLATFKYMTKI